MCPYKCPVLVLVILAELSNGQSTLSELNGEVRDYFEMGLYKKFQSKWLKYKTALENSVESAMKTMNGERKMNVLLRNTDTQKLLTGGFYVTDNIVALLLSNLTLRDLPYIEMPDVKVALAGNALRFEGDLTKMFIDVEYLLFRNKSDILFSGVPQNPYQHSPFSFQQVESHGGLTIIAEGCTLTGIGIAKLKGQKITLDHDTLHVRGCRFTIEISTPFSGTPPVIAPYFSDEQKNQLQRLLSRPIRTDVAPRLQGALFSIINATSLFGFESQNFQKNQAAIFQKTTNYISNLIQKMNALTTQKNSGSIPIQGLAIIWEEWKNGQSEICKLIIDGVTLSNLDSVYSGHKGGPYKLMSRKIAEELVFSSLQVRGRITVQNSTSISNYELGAELLDVAVDMFIELEGRNVESAVFEYCGWRAMEYSSQDILYLVNGNLLPDLLIKAYLNSLLPGIIQKYLEDIFREAERFKPEEPSGEKVDLEIEECIKKLREAGMTVIEKGKNQAEQEMSREMLAHVKSNLLDSKYVISGLDEPYDKQKLSGDKENKEKSLLDPKYAISGISGEDKQKLSGYKENKEETKLDSKYAISGNSGEE